MTREEIIDFCEMKAELEPENEDIFNCIVTTLKHERCENAVDKKKVFDILRRHHREHGRDVDGDWVPGDYTEDIYDEIKALPPVIPTACIAKVTFDKDDLQKFVDEAVKDIVVERKKSKWIKRESITGLELYYECSNCGNHCLYKYVEIGFQNAKTKFCPNCGAEMEVEE